MTMKATILATPAQHTQHHQTGKEASAHTSTQPIQGTQFTTQASLMSGPTLAPSQGSTVLDEKFKEAMTQFAAQSKQMEDKQKELQSFKDMTETRFRDIEDKLGTLVDMFKKSSTTQHTMQDTLTEQQSQLAKITEMLTRMSGEDDEESHKSPPRKLRRPEREQTTGKTESMELEAPSSQE
jgi:hypothetical protein